MSLTEGKNREVRHVLAHLGLQVSRLIRTAYGPFTLAGLEPGEVDEDRPRRTRRVPADAEMRIIAGEWRGRPIEAPPGARHPAHRRPGPRDAVLDARQPPRHVRRPARRRPVRRQRRARLRGAVARRGAAPPSSKTTPPPRRPSGATPTGSAPATGSRSSLARRWPCPLRPVRPDFRRSALRARRRNGQSSAP